MGGRVAAEDYDPFVKDLLAKVQVQVQPQLELLHFELRHAQVQVQVQLNRLIGE